MRSHFVVALEQHRQPGLMLALLATLSYAEITIMSAHFNANSPRPTFLNHLSVSSMLLTTLRKLWDLVL